MSFPVQEGGGVGGGGGMWGSLGSIQVGAACGIRSVKMGLLLLPGEKEGHHSSTNTHQSWFSHIPTVLYRFLFPFKTEREGSGCFYAPLCSFQECLQCLPGIPACWLWFEIKGAAFSVPSADPKGDYSGLNVSPFVGQLRQILLRCAPVIQATQVEIERRHFGQNVGHVELKTTYLRWRRFQRSGGFCGENLILALNRPQLKYRWRYQWHLMVKFKSKRLFPHWLWVLCPSGCNSFAVQNTLWHLILQFGCKF